MPAPAANIDRLTAIETWAWGPHGTNGVNSDVKRHSRDIGDLFGRDETMRSELTDRMKQIEDRVAGKIDKSEERMADKLDGLYKLVVTVGASVVLAALGIIATLITQGAA